MKKYVVKLTEEERSSLETVVGTGHAPGYRIKRAQCLLACDQGECGPGWTDDRVCQAYGLSNQTLRLWRKAAVEGGVASVLDRKVRFPGPRPMKFTGDVEARLTALACSKPPKGRARWTLRLLADRVVQLEIVDSASHETVRRTLKKTSLSLG